MKLSQGFSLLEVIMVVVIIAVIIAYGYPKYIHYVTKTRRIDGQVAILELATKMNDYYASHHGYQHADLITLNASDTSPEGYYRLKILKATRTQYELAAQPLGTQAKHDKLCGSFTYNQAGIKGITGQGKAEDCW